MKHAITGLAAFFLAVTTAAAQQQTPQPSSLWELDAARNATQIQTGLQCPKSFGTFERISYKTEVSRIFMSACFYGSVSLGTTLLLELLHPEGRSVQSILDMTTGNIAKSLASSMQRNDTFSFPSAYSWVRKGYAGEFAANGQRVPVNVDDLATSVSGWHLGISVMYPVARAAEASQAVSDFSAHIEKTLAPHLAACTAAPAMSPAANLVAVAARGIVLGDIAKWAKSTLMRATSADAPAWCPQEPLWLNGTTYILSRNIKRTEASVAVVGQIVTLGTGIDHYAVFDGKNLIVIRNEPRDLAILSVYDGNVALETVARTLLNGTTPQALVRIGKADNTIITPARLLTP